MTVLAAVNLAILGFLLALLRHAEPGTVGYHFYLVDLAVYRYGGQFWLSGADLYGPFPWEPGYGPLPFTYPPFAAIVFSPLALVPFWLAAEIITVGSLGLLVVVVAFVLRADRVRLSGLRLSLALLLVVPASLLLEPVRENLYFGQINIILMTLVAVDCLASPDRWYGRRCRGLLVGVAAAIKLTPAVFVLFLLLDRRDRWATPRAVAAFLAAAGLGFLFAPGDSIDFWTRVLGHTARIGATPYADNQSLMGALARFGLIPPTRTELWLALAVLAIAVAALAAWRALAAGRTSLALGAIAVAGLLISPESWSHHWVWAAPLLVSLGIIAVRERSWWAAVLTAIGVLVFVCTPLWLLPNGGGRELSWTPWQHLFGNVFTWFGILLLVAVAVLAHRAHGSAHRDPPGQLAEVTR
ncbi:MAG TPA: glycosyltransferase 87 family protein [Pseudonocardiaceae bacterium]